MMKRAEQRRPHDLARCLGGEVEALVAGEQPAQRDAAPRAKRRRQFSTMMTAPSTISPKSSAPRLIRLPETRFCTMPVMVSSIESGMIAAVMSAARKLPSSRNSTTMTSKRAFEQVGLDGVDRAVDERRAVVDRS